MESPRVANPKSWGMKDQSFQSCRPRPTANQSRPTPELVNAGGSCPPGFLLHVFQGESHASGPLTVAKGLASSSNHCDLQVCDSAGCALPRGRPSLASSAGTTKSPCRLLVILQRGQQWGCLRHLIPRVSLQTRQLSVQCGIFRLDRTPVPYLSSPPLPMICFTMRGSVGQPFPSNPGPSWHLSSSLWDRQAIP